MSRFDNTLEATFIGGLVTTALFGISCMQAFHYYQEHQDDSKVLKTLIGFVLLCGTTHMVLTAHALYWYMITNYVHPSALEILSSSISAGVFVATIGDTVIRLFFAHRIWILSRGRYALMLPLVLLSILILASGTTLSVTAIHAGTFRKAQQLKWLVRLALALMVAGDIYIVICLCFLFHHGRSGISMTDSILHNLILYSVNTGLVSSVSSTVCLVMSIRYPATFIWIGTYFPLTKLYCNTILATLNARKSLRSARGALYEQRTRGVAIEGSEAHESRSKGSKTYPLIKLNGSGHATFSPQDGRLGQGSRSIKDGRISQSREVQC